MFTFSAAGRVHLSSLLSLLTYASNGDGAAFTTLTDNAYTTLCAMLTTELSKAYLNVALVHLEKTDCVTTVENLEAVISAEMAD